MRYVLVSLLVLSACGKEIGDDCDFDADCDPNGTRECLEPQDNEGYCTIRGCDETSCPEDSACIRFFTGGFTNRPCDPAAPGDACTLDELCSLEGLCVPRSSESRFCMATCGDDSDCREGYECRDLELMRAHGGEPVDRASTDTTKFCATRPLDE